MEWIPFQRLRCKMLDSFTEPQSSTLFGRGSNKTWKNISQKMYSSVLNATSQPILPHDMSWYSIGCLCVRRICFSMFSALCCSALPQDFCFSSFHSRARGGNFLTLGGIESSTLQGSTEATTPAPYGLLYCRSSDPRISSILEYHDYIIGHVTSNLYLGSSR